MRLALGLLDKAYWQIDPDTDLQPVYAYLNRYYDSAATRIAYGKGLRKLAQYVRLRRPGSRPEKAINWDYYCTSLPEWLVHDLRTYLAHRRRAWLPDLRRRRSLDTLSHLTGSLRWLAQRTPLVTVAEITPELWFDYVDYRLAAGITPTTLNGELRELQQFLRFLAEQPRPVCDRMGRVEPLAQGPSLPRDVPQEQLRRLREQIELDAASPHAGIRRMGLMDRAWFLLMLHSGLRVGEVRRLLRAELDLPTARVRIEQSKGLKDRLVPLSQAAVTALEAYLPVRGPAGSDHLFLFRHEPLSVTYCSERLGTYGKRCGLKVAPHQLRHSCATLLLNAGVPVLTVQAPVLGHKFIDTTLGYARLYDGTVAADYYRAMAAIENQVGLVEDSDLAPATPGHLLAMVDSLRNGTLNEGQRETIQ